MKQVFKLVSCALFVVLLGSCSSGAANDSKPDFIDAPIAVGKVPVADERINVKVANFQKGRQRVGYEVMVALPSNLRPQFVYSESYTRYHSEVSLLKGHCTNTILYTTITGEETSEVFGCAGHTSEQHKY